MRACVVCELRRLPSSPFAFWEFRDKAQHSCRTGMAGFYRFLYTLWLFSLSLSFFFFLPPSLSLAAFDSSFFLVVFPVRLTPTDGVEEKDREEGKDINKRSASHIDCITKKIDVRKTCRKSNERSAALVKKPQQDMENRGRFKCKENQTWIEEREEVGGKAIQSCRNDQSNDNRSKWSMTKHSAQLTSSHYHHQLDGKEKRFEKKTSTNQPKKKRRKKWRRRIKEKNVQAGKRREKCVFSEESSGRGRRVKFIAAGILMKWWAIICLLFLAARLTYRILIVADGFRDSIKIWPFSFYTLCCK